MYGCTVSILAIVVLIKILRGSRSRFALLLASLQLLNGLQEADYYFLYKDHGDSQEKFYHEQIDLYLYYFTYLQTWIFAMRYSESAIVCHSAPIMSLNNLKIVKNAGYVIYSGSMITIFVIICATYPG